MSKYQIYRWDVVMSGNSTFKSPILYIKPDLDFLEFARANNFALMAVVEGTGLQYDEKQIPSIIKQSFSFNKSGYYVVALNSNWYGYPKEGQFGTVSFLGLVKPETNKYTNKDTNEYKENINSSKIENSVKQSNRNDKPEVTLNDNLNKNKMKKNVIIFIGMILLIALIILLLK